MKTNIRNAITAAVYLLTPIAYGVGKNRCIWKVSGE